MMKPDIKYIAKPSNIHFGTPVGYFLNNKYFDGQEPPVQIGYINNGYFFLNTPTRIVATVDGMTLKYTQNGVTSTLEEMEEAVQDVNQ